MSGISPLPEGETSLILGELADAAPEAPFAQASPFGETPAAPAPDVRPFALGEDSFRPVERLTGLERMGEKLARTLKPALEPFARARITVTPAPIEIMPFDSWAQALPPFFSLSHYRMRPLKGGMLIGIEPDFVAGLVETFYGGTGAAHVHRGTDFTPSEELLLNRLLERIVSILAEHWQEVTPVETGLVARETSVSHIAFIRGDEPAVLQRFAVQLPAFIATLTIVYPLAMLRPIEERMASKVHDQDTSGDGSWRARLEQALGDVALPVRSILARPEISVAELLALKPGDMIPITLAQRTPLLAGARHIAEGMIGEQEGRAALMIEKVGTKG